MTIEEIQSIQADANGIITIEVDGIKKRYVKAKRIDFLQRNPSGNKEKKKRKPAEKKVKKEKLPKGPDKRGHANRVPIIAIMPDGKKIPFASSMEAVKTLKVNKSAVSKVLTGVQQHVNNIRFKFQKTA